jgi:hypothetical protein
VLGGRPTPSNGRAKPGKVRGTPQGTPVPARRKRRSYALPPLPPSANAPDLLFGPGTGRFEQRRESERRADDRLQDMEPLGPPRLTPIQPPGDLGSLLAVNRDQGVSLGSRSILQIEERLAVDHRKEHGEEPRDF